MLSLRFTFCPPGIYPSNITFAYKLNFYAVAVKRNSETPPIAINRLQNRWLMAMSQRYGNELPVGLVEVV